MKIEVGELSQGTKNQIILEFLENELGSEISITYDGGHGKRLTPRDRDTIIRNLIKKVEESE